MKRLLLISLLAIVGLAQSSPVTFKWAAMSGTGTTAALPLPYGFSQHTIQIIVTGGPSGCTVNLDGSLDGVNWFDLSGGQTCTSNTMFHVVSKPVAYVRGDLTALTGGTSPTVTISYEGIQ